MKHSRARSGSEAYQHIGTVTSVEVSDAHGLINLLLQGGLTSINRTIGLIQAGDISKKGEEIAKLLSILFELQSALDMEQGGDIALNLYNLYGYIIELTTTANINNDTEKLDEAASLLSTIKESWNLIPDTARQRENQ